MNIFKLKEIAISLLENEAIQIKQDFFKMAGFPNVLGAIDGTLISIIAPKENEPEYVCRKGFHALNIQVVADTSLRFAYSLYKYSNIPFTYKSNL